MEAILLIPLAGAYITSIVVCFQKGKPVFGWLGIAGAVIFPLVVYLGWFPVIGAIRIAKPDSAWATTRYSPEQKTAALLRFPFPVTPGSAPGHEPVSDQSGRVDEALIIRNFLTDALDRGLLEESAYRRLRQLLESPAVAAVKAQSASDSPSLSDELLVDAGGLAPSSAKATARPVGVTQPASLEDEWTALTEAVAAVRARREATPPTVRPSAAVPPSGSIPDTPAPSPTRTRLAVFWEAISSDLSIHGFAYLGVLLTFVGVLGFLLFAFKDFPTAAQPFVELAIVLVFFGWAWLLRRQQAEVMASAMELMGGMTLPLVLFAALVDGAPFPPDFEGGNLVAMMTFSSLALAGAYHWITRRNPNSILRGLVAPLVWLAAMTAGFAFKVDEPLRSHAITRPVSHQPALAALAIAATLALARSKPRHALAGPTVRSGLVGVLAAYILTVSLSVGEGWESTTPLLILGGATFVSVEFLGRWYGRLQALAVARPILLAAVLLPLAPTWGTAWTGLAGTIGYLALTEFDLRTGDSNRLATAMSPAGALASALVSIAEPRAALASFTVASIWAHLRRAHAHTPPSWVGTLTAAAAILPLAVGRSLLELMEPGWAWLVMATIVLVVSAGVRYLGVGDTFWSYWVTGAAVIVSVVSYRTVAPSGELSAALVVSTVAVTVAPYWPVLRVWLGVALGSLALGSALPALDLAPAWEAASWAAVGLLLVAAAAVWGRQPAGHLALAGHLMGTAAALLPSDGWVQVGVLGLWATGWVVSTAASARNRESVTSVLQEAAESAGMPARVAASSSWVAPLAAAITAPMALLSAANQLDEFAAHRSWTGLVVAGIALLYALIARSISSHLELGRVLTVASTVAAVLGVSVAAPDEWPTALAAGGVIGVALLLGAEGRKPWFIWYAWLMSGVIVVSGAGIAGVGVDDLYLAALVWGGTLMVGGLLVDDVKAGRRQVGEWLRVRWTRYPVTIGALAAPLSLGPVFAEEPSVFGWWALGVAGLYFLVAYLLRMGAVTGPAFALATVGAVAVSPWPLLDPSWRLVVISSGLVLVAWGADRLGGADADPWHRWDLGPLVVSHIVGAFALVYATGQDQLFATAGAFGLLAVAVGVWKGRAWIEAGNAMVVLSAWDAGPDWLALALAATAVRAAVGVHKTTGPTRTSYQLMGVASTSAAWAVLADAQGWSPAETVSYSALFFGAWALSIAALARWWKIGRDTTLWWGSASVAAFLVIGSNIRDPSATGIIDGPWLALGLAMLAASLEVVASRINPALRKLTAPISGLAWLALAAGLQWSVATFVVGTAVTFGALLVALVEGLRYFASPRLHVEEATEYRIPLVRVWVAFGMAGVTVAGLLALIADVDPVVWRAVAAGLAMVAVAMARGASPLRLGWLRPATTVTALASLTALSASFEVPTSAVTAGAIAVAVTASLFMLLFWRAMPESAWLGSLGTLGIAANLEAAAAWLVSGQDRRSLVALLVSFGIQAVAYGLARKSPPVLGMAPPMLAGAFILGALESVSGDPQWFTIPLALVLLSEVEILAWASRRRDTLAASTPTLVLEWAGVGLLASPPLVEMFVTGPSHGLTAFAIAALIFGWALVTRIRRRAVFAASLAVGTAILLLFSAATAAAPVSAFFWIVAVGVGFTVMLVAGLVEAYRSKRGHIMLRIDQLMEGWD